MVYPQRRTRADSRSQLKARISGAWGRAAEDVIFGSAEATGAGNDLQQVTGARQMVTKFGMSDLGPLSLESQSGEVF